MLRRIFSALTALALLPGMLLALTLLALLAGAIYLFKREVVATVE